MSEAPGFAVARRTFHVLGSAALVIAALYWGQKIVIPFALAVLLAFVLSPLGLVTLVLGIVFSLTLTSLESAGLLLILLRLFRGRLGKIDLAGDNVLPQRVELGTNELLLGFGGARLE